MRPALKSVGLTMLLLGSTTIALYVLTIWRSPLLAQSTTPQDQKVEGDLLLQQGDQQIQTSQYSASQRTWQQALEIYQVIKNKRSEENTLSHLGLAYDALVTYKKTIEYQDKKKQDRTTEVQSLLKECANHLQRGENNKVLEQCPKGIEIAKELKNPLIESKFLAVLGLAYVELKEYQKGIDSAQASLAILEQIKERPVDTLAQMIQIQLTSILIISSGYNGLEDYPKAIKLAQVGLKGAKGFNRSLEGSSLSILAQAHNGIKEHQKALEYAQASLKIAQELKDKKQELLALSAMITAHEKLGDLRAANEAVQQLLKIVREAKNPQLEMSLLTELSKVYQRDLQNYPKAIESAQASLKIAQEIKNRQGELEALAALADAHDSLKEYQTAITLTQQRLIIARELKDRKAEVLALVGLSGAYSSLHEYQQAVSYAQSGLKLAREMNDPTFESIALSAFREPYQALGDFQGAIEVLEQDLALARRSGNRYMEALALANLSLAYGLRDPDKTIAFGQEGLKLTRELKARNVEALILNGFSLAYKLQGNYQKGLEVAQQLLEIARSENNRRDELEALESISLAYRGLGNYPKVIELAQQRLAIVQDPKNLLTESQTLNALSQIYDDLRDNRKAIEVSQQLLQIARKAGNRPNELAALASLSQAYLTLNEPQQVLEFGQASLTLAKELKNRRVQLEALNHLSSAYSALGEPQKALEYSQQHLALAQELKNPVNESLALLSLGQAQITLGEFRKGIALGQQGLEISRKIKSRDLESSALVVLAAYHNEVGEYQQALELGQASLAIAQSLQNPRQAVEPLVVLSEVYKQLGEYSKMLEFAQQQLVATRQDRDRYGEGVALSQLGLAYFAMGDNQKAVELAQQGLAIFRETKSFWGQCYALIVLSNGYGALGQYEKAIATAQQSLTIAKQQKNPTLELYAFNVLASLYRKTDRIKDAISTYQEALTADSQTEASADFVAYAGLARIYRDMNSPTVAITYYKQAINGIEQIRGNIRGLPLNLQKSFLQDIQNFERIKNADVYRELADLLISEGRIGEAQQVLELLKIQELDDLTPSKRSTNRLTELALNSVEQEIQTKYSNLITFGQKVKDCKQDCSTLKKQLTTLREQFEAYQQSVQKALADGTLVRIDERNKDFIASASKIVNAQPGTVLIYPLVLSDKVHLLWASQGGVLSSVTCSVGEQQLNRMIANFQDALQAPNDISAVKQHGKALYNCLVKPLEEKGEWEKNKIQNLVIAADRAINYIPIGALFDGKQFLIQRYTFSNILNAGLTDVEAKLPQNPSVLGLGITEELDDFSALPYVKPELQAIIRSNQNPQGIYPGNVFINQTSTASAFEDNLDKYQIVHIATHGKFDPSNPNGSYLLLSSGQPGKGDRYTVTRIQLQENLKNVHLVVLSACQTASGESASNGIEIQGMSAAFVRDRAKAVIASLWNVDDASTSLLMQQFYQNLATGKMTKAEALRQAQLRLLQGKLTAKDAPQRGPTLMPVGAPPQRRSLSADFSHPYYWAPFILIGNGL